jgi:hypothetical protein
MAKVQQESQNAYLVGRNVRNLKLARTLGKGMQLQLEVLRNGQRLVQVDTGDAHVRDIKSYASKMTRGLFLRNVPNVRPKKPIIHIIDKQLYT